MPRIYSLRKKAQERDPVPQDAVYVGRGRGSKWGNPFPLMHEEDREIVYQQFLDYAKKRLKRDPGWLEPLRGRDLACWCQSPSDPEPRRCHAEGLLRLIKEVYGDA